MSAIPREIAQLRTPPSSIEAEQAVLGALLIRPETLAKVTLDEADFFRRDHRLIYQAIREQESAGKPFDVVTLGEWFEASGRAQEIGGSGRLIDIAQSVWSAANIDAYVAIVRDKAVLRRLIEIGSSLTTDGFGGEDATELLDRTISELMALAKTEHRCDFSLQQAVRMAWEEARIANESAGALRGVPTGYERMDKRLGGFHGGDLIFLAARPSMGKTALMVNLAHNAAEKDFSVGVISGEQSVMQIGQRSVSAESTVPAERMRNGDFQEEDWSRLTHAIRAMHSRKIRIYDRSAPTLDEIARIARRWKHEHDIAILFVDYLQRVRVPKADNRIDEVSEASRGLKTLARDLNIPVVCLAQVKAEVDKRTGDKRPNLGDIANSDESTLEADLIAFLYRDEVYNDNSADAGIAELNVEKYRHGPTGRFKLRFFAETMRFENLWTGEHPGERSSGRDQAAGPDA